MILIRYLFLGHFIFSLSTIFYVSSFIESPLIWISTRNEGIAEHWSQLNKIFQTLERHCNRRIIIVPFKNDVHYNDSGLVSLCDYFVFPLSISCGKQTAADVVRTHICTISECKSHNWYCLPDAFGLSNVSDFKDAVIIRKPSYCSDSCCLLKNNLPNEQNHYFDIIFREKYLYYLDLMKSRLSDVNGIRNSNQTSFDYVVVHWRRGDQLWSRCQTKADDSFNCYTVIDFVKIVKSILQIGPVTYIATNERNHSILHALETAGFLTWRVFGWRHFKSVEIFICELALMIDSKAFYYSRASTIHSMVNTARRQRSKQPGIQLSSMKY